MSIQDGALFDSAIGRGEVLAFIQLHGYRGNLKASGGRLIVIKNHRQRQQDDPEPNLRIQFRANAKENTHDQGQ